MKQIDSIARLLKSELCGKNNHPFRSVTIYLDTDDDDAYIPEWLEKETEYYLNK